MKLQLSLMDLDTLVIVALNKRTDVTYKRKVFKNPVNVVYTISLINFNAKPLKIQIYPLEKVSEITFPVIIPQTEVVELPNGTLELFDGEELPRYDDPIDKAKYDVCHSIYMEFALYESITKDPIIQKYKNDITSTPRLETQETAVKEDAEQVDAGKAEELDNPTTIDQQPKRKDELDALCIKWANRGYVPKDYNLSEFLNESQSTYISVSQFKNALKDAFKRGKIAQDPKTKRYKPKD